MKAFIICTSIAALIYGIIAGAGPGAVFIPGVILAYACFSMS